MKTLLFDLQPFEKPLFEELAKNLHLSFSSHRLTEETAPLAAGYDAVSLFVNDRANREVLSKLKEAGVKLLALRSAGYNHVNLAAAQEFGIRVVRVPAYSPHAVAEHAVALLLALNRKIVRAASRVRDLNFSLDGLMGFDLHGKTVGVIGVGKIGQVFAQIMKGFGCEVLLCDKAPGHSNSSLDEVFQKSDIISLHLPLTPESLHLINEASLKKMKKGVMLINTGRGGLIDTKALIAGLKTGKVGAAGLDVYEEEEAIFFQDLSSSVLQDDTLARLMTFPNVLITAHQAFLTKEAVEKIVSTTGQNLQEFYLGKTLTNEIKL